MTLLAMSFAVTARCDPPLPPRDSMVATDGGLVIASPLKEDVSEYGESA